MLRDVKVQHSQIIQFQLQVFYLCRLLRWHHFLVLTFTVPSNEIIVPHYVEDLPKNFLTLA